MTPSQLPIDAPPAVQTTAARLTAIILNWNLPYETLSCVRSLQAAAPPGMALLIVDNGSHDDSVVVLERELKNTATILQTGRNLGFAGGMNAGMRAALADGAEWLLLLNNDTEFDPAMVRHLMATATAHPQAGLIGPIIYYHADPQRIWRFADRIHPWLPTPIRLTAADLARANGQPFRTDYLTACAVLINRRLLETVGLFDESFFMYFEDADLSRRALEAGFEVWCVPAARMWHKVSLSANKDKPLTRYAQAWGRARFYRRYRHGPAPILTILYLLLRMLWTTLNDIRQGDWQLIGPLWRGTLAGMWRSGKT